MSKDDSYKEVTIEISDICNASCKWCSTGRKTRNLDNEVPFMTPVLLRAGLERLKSLGIISSDTTIELFNWGEPFLNPDFDTILSILCEMGFHYHLSTNGSVFREISANALENLDYLTFSLSGMSETTYSRIHKLDHDKVLNNIIKTAGYFKNYGCEKKIILNFHIYQFNLHELEEARRFCEDLGIRFVPTYAYINDFVLFNSFLGKTLDATECTEVATELLTYPYFETAQKKPNDYQCPQWHKLVFDQKFRLVPCCRLTSDEALCSVFDIDLTEKIAGICRSEYCRECLSTGQSYIIHKGELYPKWYHETILPQTERTEKDKIDIINLKSVIEQRGKDVNTLEEALKQREKDVSTLLDALKHREKDVDTLEDALKHREKDVDTLENALKHREKDMGTLEEALKHREKDVRTLEEALKHREKDISSLEEALQKHVSNVGTLEAKYKMEASQMIDELESNRAFIATTEAALKDITSQYKDLTKTFPGKIALKLIKKAESDID